MGDCVPDWEEMCGATEIGITLDSLEHLLKEKWENVELSSDIANLQSMLVSSSGHVSNQSPLGDLANTGVRAMNLEPTSESTSACMWRTENSATVTLSEPPILVFTTGVKKSGDGSCSIQTSQTDEMVSWLQYPLENFLEKEYCGIPRKHPGCGGLPPKDGASGRISFDFPQNGTGFPRTKQMAELKGADVDAGLEPEAGFEGEKGVLPRVRCVQPIVPKGVGLGCTGNVLALGVDPTRKPNPCATGMSSTPVIDTSSGPPSMLNFPHFSRPAAVVKANLHSLGATGQSRLRQSIVRTTNAFPHPLVALSSRSGNIGLGFSPEQAFCGEGPSCLQGTTTEPNSHLRLCGDRMDVESTGCVCDVAGNRATKSCSMCPTLRCTSYQEQLPSKSYETSEATFSSGGSGVSIVQGAKPGTNSMKRKLTSEDAECPGEDAEDESVDVKKSSSGRSNVTKRSRAAEVHNLSERRRRDRINEKMRALQDLIPYSNKTDKASMLDEAIEYLKMLQLQLKMMSMRSGITLPAMLLPPGSPPSRTHLAALDQGGSMESVKHASFRCGLGQTAPGQRLVPTLCGPSNVLPGSTADSQLHIIPLGVDALNVYHTSNARSDVQAGERFNAYVRLQEQSLDQIQYQQ